MLLEHGITHMDDMSRIGRLLAIHHAHQAVELSLRAKAEQFNEFPHRYPQIKKALKKHKIKIPYERALDELNTTRNLAQHHGQVPEQTTVVKLVSIAKEFIIDFWFQQFDLKYEEVSFVKMVQDQELRETLKNAEQLLNEQKYDDAVEQAVLAIYKNLWRLEEKFPPPYVPQSIFGGYIEPWRDLLRVVLSMPYASKLKKILETTGIIFMNIPGGTPVMQKMKEYKATKEDANFVYSTALEYTIWAEQKYF